ncbi:hypothetical protein [Yoonia sp. SS1-5]|uniref:DUF3329 domain-containing protein n=1 Tax=Yoonia rhodophyticola TaxID=3137370 RepID=A0AAN0NKT1_9RHOB
MRKLFDLRHPFFAPQIRRVLTVAVTVGWALFELLNGNPGWAVMFGAVAAYCYYEFFVIYDPQNYVDPDDT